MGEDSSLPDLKDRFSMLNKELAVKTTECTRLTKELVPYHETLKRKNELEAEVLDKNVIITTLTNETSEQKKKIAAYELELAELSQLKLIVAQLKEKLSVSEADRVTLRAEVEKLKHRVEHLEPFEMEVTSLKRNLESAQSEISRLVEELKKRTVDYNSLSSKYDQLKIAYSSLEQRESQLTKELAAMSQRCEQSESALLVLREKFSALEVELNMLKESAALMEAEMMRWKEAASRHEAKIAEMDKMMAAMKASSSALELKAAEAEAECKSLAAKLKEAEILHGLKDEEILELKTKLQANHLKLSQAQAESSSSRESADEKHAAMQKMSDMCKAQEQALEHMKADVQYYKDQADTLEQRFNEAEGRSMHYQIQVETLNIKYDGMMDERDTVMQQSEELRQNLSIKDKEISALRNQIVSGESQNKAMQNRIEAKQEEIKTLNRAAPDLRSKMVELEDSHRQTEATKMELVKLQEHEQANVVTIKELQSALAESESKVATVASTAASQKAKDASSLNKLEKEVQKTTINLDFKIKELNAAKAEIARLKELPREHITEVTTVTNNVQSSRERDLIVENENLKKFLAELKAHYATLREESVKNKEMAWKEIQALREMQTVECKICSNPTTPTYTPPRTITTTTKTSYLEKSPIVIVEDEVTSHRTPEVINVTEEQVKYVKGHTPVPVKSGYETPPKPAEVMTTTEIKTTTTPIKVAVTPPPPSTTSTTTTTVVKKRKVFGKTHRVTEPDMIQIRETEKKLNLDVVRATWGSGDKNKAATKIQAAIRGHLSRIRSSHMLDGIPSMMIVKIDGASGITLENGYKPDTFVVVSTVGHTKKGTESCFSARKTDTIAGTQDPKYDATMEMAAAGHPKIVFNVMSKHGFGADTFLGQAVIDMASDKTLTDHLEHHFILPITRKVTSRVFDSKGNEIKNLKDCETACGTLSVSINFPPVRNNLCGWFFDIKTSSGYFGTNVNGEKIWVVLKNDILNIYLTPFDISVIGQLKLHDIADLKEKVFDNMEGGLTMHGMNFVMKPGVTPSDEFWAWADDGGELKGLWTAVFSKHLHLNHAIAMSTKTRKNPNRAKAKGDSVQKSGH